MSATPPGTPKSQIRRSRASDPETPQGDVHLLYGMGESIEAPGSPSPAPSSAKKMRKRTSSSNNGSSGISKKTSSAQDSRLVDDKNSLTTTPVTAANTTTTNNVSRAELRSLLRRANSIQAQLNDLVSDLEKLAR